MALNLLSPLNPALSNEIRAFDQPRAEEVDRRHQLLVEYMLLKGFDALLLQSPEMFGWLTCGANNQRAGIGAFGALLITEEARVVLCQQSDTPQLFDRELNGLGFLQKERPWTEDLHLLRQDAVRGRRVGGDVWYPGTENVQRELQDFRLQLSNREAERYREFGLMAAHAVEATARSLQRGESEQEIAGQLSHRLWRHGLEPVHLQVLADGQGHRYRQWTASEDRVERHCVLSAMVRREGLHLALSRTVCFGPPSEEVQDTFDVATLLQATGMFFSQAGWAICETWQRVARIYEKFGVPDEWRLAEQAEFVGYGACEERFTPDATREIPSTSVIHWHPSVRASLVSDTMLVHANSREVITRHENWPTLTVRVKGAEFNRPGILVRDAHG
ncbi:MAG: M24 family metallopeptidase [Planctomycetaceae bacterium]|nr:M24 family metallopeptidase [Planctomycetaceae bacterium]